MLGWKRALTGSFHQTLATIYIISVGFADCGGKDLLSTEDV